MFEIRRIKQKSFKIGKILHVDRLKIFGRACRVGGGGMAEAKPLRARFSLFRLFKLIYYVKIAGYLHSTNKR